MRISDWSSDVCSSDLLLDNHWLTVTLEVDERSQLLLQDGCSAANGLFRIQGTVGFQINNQLVQVSTLFDTGVFHHVCDTANRAERRVKLQATDAAAFVFIALTRVCRFITTTTSYGEQIGRAHV